MKLSELLFKLLISGAVIPCVVLFLLPVLIRISISIKEATRIANGRFYSPSQPHIAPRWWIVFCVLASLATIGTSLYAVWFL